MDAAHQLELEQQEIDRRETELPTVGIIDWDGTQATITKAVDSVITAVIFEPPVPAKES